MTAAALPNLHSAQHLVERAWLGRWTLGVRGCDAAAAAFVLCTGADGAGLGSLGSAGRLILLDGSGARLAAWPVRPRGAFVRQMRADDPPLVVWGAHAAARVERLRAASVVVLDAPRDRLAHRLAQRWARTRWTLHAIDERDAAAWRGAGVPADRLGAAVTLPSPDGAGRRPPDAEGRARVVALCAATPRLDARRFVWALTVAYTAGQAVCGELPAQAGRVEAALRHARLFDWRVPITTHLAPGALRLGAGSIAVMDSRTDRGHGVRRVFEAAAERAGAALVDIVGLSEGPRHARSLVGPMTRAIALCGESLRRTVPDHAPGGCLHTDASELGDQ